MKKFLFTFALILVTPCLAFAQQKYQPLINIPGVTDAGDGTFAGYINFLYAFSIGIAGLLAVIKIIVAGVKYMMTDVVSTKSNAKGEITGALLGLLLILGAYIILNTINPRLNKQETNFDALPPDPELVTRPSVATEDGKTPDQVSSALAKNLPACSVTSSLGISANGLYTLDKIDVSKCDAADTKTALAEFAKNCTQAGGSLNGTNIYQCRNKIAYAAEKLAAIKVAQGEFAYIKSTYKPNIDANGDGYGNNDGDQRLTDAFIKLQGNSVVIDIAGFCNDIFSVAKTPQLTVLQRASAKQVCTGSNGGGFTASIANHCTTFNANTKGALTCAFPIAVVAGLNWKISDPQNGGLRPPIDYAEFDKSCKASGGVLKISSEWGRSYTPGWLSYDPKKFDCVMYK